jgi:hypothetical protein
MTTEQLAQLSPSERLKSISFRSLINFTWKLWWASLITGVIADIRLALSDLFFVSPLRKS